MQAVNVKMSTLDDLLVKRKNIQPILDLSRSLIQNADDFKRLMEKVPEFKTRPIKVRTDEIKLKEKDYSYRMTRKEQRRLQRNHGEHELQYLYQDPVPLEMRAVLLQELFAVPIDWKMLTTVRPKTKMEEEFYTRLIEMGKSQLRLKTAAAAARQRQDSSTVGSGGQHNNSVNINNLYANSNASNLVRKLKNRSGIVETRLLICAECGEELCDGKFASISLCCSFPKNPSISSKTMDE